MVNFLHVVPALYVRGTVKTDMQLGELATGGRLSHGHFVSGYITSLPGTTPKFSGSILYGEDYLTLQPDGKYLRPSLTAQVQPDDGDVPFQLIATGIIQPTAELVEITTTNNSVGHAVPYGETYSVWPVEFRGGSSKYLDLQNSIWVASVTFSDSVNADEFEVGFEIGRVVNDKTKITIGKEPHVGKTQH